MSKIFIELVQWCSGTEIIGYAQFFEKIFWNVLYYSILYNIYSAITIMNLNNGREGERESLLWFLDANT